jgi:hypothetical protein
MKTSARQKKNLHAVALGKLRAQQGYEETHRLRWEGVPPEVRTALARKAAQARWRQYRAAKRQRSA